jgi:predicted Rossmann fold nucleotide-binding protein DprA/Smf involved in DNA uptake
MATKKDETASFVLRFTQKIFQNEQDEPQIQWRGNMRHVQSGAEKNFSKFDEVTQFIQTTLTDLTVQAMEHKSPEEQKGILSKSLDLWKRMAMETPKLVMDSIKDPKKQAHHIQEQIQEQMHQVGDVLNQKFEDAKQKLEVDEWRVSSKSDFKTIVKMLEQMSEEINVLNQKVDKLSKKTK